MNKLFKGFLLVSTLGMLIGCQQKTPSESSSDSEHEETEEELIAGRELREDQLYTDSGFTIYFNKKGARIQKMTYMDDFEIAKDGFVAGRCANRIAGAQFELNDETYDLDANEGVNHLHGGSNGFGNVDWVKKSQTPATIVYELDSPDGDMGYPGNLHIEVKYTLRNNGALTMEYSARSDADTIINPTNHIWLSLNGAKSSQEHTLWIDADKYTPNVDLIPTGEIVNVAGTKYDFRTPDTEFLPANKYDDNWVLNGEGYRKVCTLTGVSLGIQCDILTDRPGLQMYNDNSYIVLETQLYPDAIHHPSWPSPILRANEDFYTKSTYIFTDLNAAE